MILLDTQAWLRLVIEPGKLSRAAASAIRRAAGSGAPALSAISVWEAGWLVRRGRIRARELPAIFLRRALDDSAVEVAAVTREIGLLAVELPDAVSADPCDRLIVATALVLGYPLVTADERIRASGAVTTIW